MNQKIQNKIEMYRLARGRARRRSGIAFVYVALALVVFVGSAALSVDLSYLHYRRAQAQNAADAAALAGAQELGEMNPEKRRQNALKRARDLAKTNGYDNDDSRVSVTGRIINEATYEARVSRVEPLFFAPIFSLLPGAGNTNFTSRSVGAVAAAIRVVPSVRNITGLGTYGYESNAVNLTLFGPDGRYQYGDPYSVKLGMDDRSPNAEYDPEGYDFQVNVPFSYTEDTLQIEIYDPDTYNVQTGSGDLDNADITDPDPTKRRRDELRDGNNGSTKLTPTTTEFRLYAPDAGPDDDPIATAIYSNDPATDLQWVTPDGFILDLRNYRRDADGLKSFRLNVRSTSGSSENGYELRAGPTRTPPVTGDPPVIGDPPPFNPDNGTNITATGRVPLNFNVNGFVKIALGRVPAEAASTKDALGKVFIKKFDTDIGGTNNKVRYRNPARGSSFQGEVGVLAGNGEWVEDEIVLPGGYNPRNADEELWTAEYNANINDTSVWEMSYTGPPTGQPGDIYLTR